MILHAALALTTLIGVMVILESHSTEYREWHPITSEENGLVALVTLGGVWLALLVASRLGFATGLIAGLASFFGSLIAAGAIAVVHILSDVTHNTTGNLALIGCLGLSALGLAIFILELVLRVQQRDADLRAESGAPEPRLPKAIAIGKGV